MKYGMIGRIVRWTAFGMGAVAVVHIVSALTLDRLVQYRELEYRSGRIPRELDGYTLAFVSDVHGYPDSKLAEVVGHINGRGVRLAVLGGDFLPGNLYGSLGVLSRIEAPDGIWGVAGNHDNASRLRRAMGGHGMTLLENDGVRIRPGLYLAGVEDLYSRSSDPAAAIAGAHPADFVLLLAHNPDVAMLPGFGGVDLTLAGHTHGGEVTFLGLVAPALPLVSRYGQRFASGWAKAADGSDVLVCNGLGNHFPFRVFARPQIIFLTLRAG